MAAAFERAVVNIPRNSHYLWFVTGVLHFSNKTIRMARRTFLSASYSCETSWAKRLSEPVVEKVKYSNYYAELNQQFHLKKAISAIDLDLFAHTIVDAEHLEELEDLVHRFRRTPNTIHMLASTSHAVIRSFLQFGQYDSLLRMLNDRLNYGVFPDYYCYNLMMDTFLKQKNYRDAAKVAVLMMLQEDFGHPISKHLAMFSCLSYLRHPQPEPWNIDPPTPSVVETDEQVIIRLNYLPPNYFDDHFDLNDPVKLVGKTLAMVGREFADEMGITCQLIGLAMHEKWDKLKLHLERLIAENKQEVVFKEAITRMKENLERVKATDQTQNLPDEELNILISKIESQSISEDILEILSLQLTSVIAKCEDNDIQMQQKLYDTWAGIRQSEVDKQVQNYIRSTRIKKLEEMKEDLRKREQLLFFFENFEKHAMKVEEYDKVAKEVATQKSKDDDKVYIPPETRRHNF